MPHQMLDSDWCTVKERGRWQGVKVACFVTPYHLISRDFGPMAFIALRNLAQYRPQNMVFVLPRIKMQWKFF